MRNYLIFTIFISIALLFALLWQKEKQSTTLVQRMDSNLSLNIRGVLEASKFVQITSPILSNHAKIIELKPEGSLVRQGEIIARFDIKPFMDTLDTLSFKVEEAKATFIRAQKDIGIQKSQNMQALKSVQSAIEITKINLNDIKNGEGLIKLQELRGQILEYQREIVVAKEELKDYESLFQQGYISKKEKQSVENRLNKFNELLQNAKARVANYQKYAWPKQIKEQQITLENLELKRKATKEQNRLSLEAKSSALGKAKTTLAQYLREEEKAKKNVAFCDVKAPIDGRLLYNIIPKSPKRGKVDIGDSIWYNQSFMQIPDTKQMIIKALIKEVDLRYIKLGQRATITLDAYLDKRFIGHVSYIDSISKSKPQSQSKYFETIISVDNSEHTLRSGMSASIEIVYASLKAQLMVSPRAIFTSDKGSYLQFPNGRKRYIEVIDISKHNALIKGDIGEGTQVVLHWDSKRATSANLLARKWF